MSLQQAVDALVRFVERFGARADHDAGVKELLALNHAVYVEVIKRGLGPEHLPREDRTFDQPGVKFFGKANVPGKWLVVPGEPHQLVLWPTLGWLADMRALRALGEIADTDRQTWHSPDFRITVWYGELHLFSLTQAVVVRELWQAWEQGRPLLKHRYLVEATGSCQDLPHLFRTKGKPVTAWGSMIRHNGKGDYWLQGPDLSRKS